MPSKRKKTKDNQPDGNEFCDEEIDEETVSEDDQSEDKNREDINNNKDETVTNNEDLEDKRVEREAYYDREGNNVNLCDGIDNLIYDARLRGYRVNKHEQENLFQHQISMKAIRTENR